MFIDDDLDWLLILSRTIHRDDRILTRRKIDDQGELTDRFLSRTIAQTVVLGNGVITPNRSSRLTLIFDPILHLITQWIAKRPYTQ